MNRSATVFAFIAILGLAFNVQAALETVTWDDDYGSGTVVWPRLIPPKGWHHDRAASIHYKFNALVPDGFDYQDAPYVISGKSILISDLPPNEQSLSVQLRLLADAYRKADSTSEVSEPLELPAPTGGKAISFQAVVPSCCWYRHVFWEEGAHYVVISVVSKSESGFHRATKALGTLLGLPDDA